MISSILTIVESATLGLLSWNPNESGCRRYKERNELSPAFKFATVGGVGASLFSFMPLCLIIIKICCIRFWCSCFLTVAFLVIAFLCQLCTSSVYPSNICLPSEANAPYACGFKLGSAFAIAALILLTITCIMTCAAPKSTKPLVRILMERDFDKESNDPCCYCCRRHKLDIPANQSNDKEEEDDDEDDVEAFQNADKDFVGESVGVPTTVDVAASDETSTAIQSNPYDVYNVLIFEMVFG